MPVNIGHPVFSGHLVSHYNGPSRPLTMARFVVVAPTFKKLKVVSLVDINVKGILLKRTLAPDQPHGLQSVCDELPGP